MLIDPLDVFVGTVLIVAPHMDDEVLACGGTVAKLKEKERIHAIYATDGMKSPSPIVPLRDSISEDLGEIRIEESRAAMKSLGVPEDNLHFLKLPEAQLSENISSLRRLLLKLIEQVNPDQILMPFRYDRHADHLAVNHVITDAYNQGMFPQAQLFEYFVYYRWRLLPAKDVRRYIDPRYLLEVNISDESNLKKAALNCFRSQTTIYYSWQTRPILTPLLIDEDSRGPEFFLRYDRSTLGSSVFSNTVVWIRIAHRLEPFLQRWKYRVGAVLSRGFMTNGSRTR